jgi:HEAT repeat protein
MKKNTAAVLLFLVLFPAFSQEEVEPSAGEDTKRLETIRYGTETEIAALIQTLKTENTPGMDNELITVAKNTRNRSILSGVFSFFADRDKAGLEERALRAIEERDDEANETVLAALAYLGKIKYTSAVPVVQELLDAEEQRFTGACIKALGLIGGSMSVAEADDARETEPRRSLRGGGTPPKWRSI